MDNVDAHFSDTGDANQGIQIGAIAVNQSPLGMDDFGHLENVLLEEPQGIGVRQHESCHLLVHQGSQRFWVDEPSRIRFHRHSLVVTEG